jgi:hypothetical protein
VNISFENDFQGELEIFDLVGTKYKLMPINASKMSIDIQDLPKGIYILNARSKEGRSAFIKVVRE